MRKTRNKVTSKQKKQKKQKTVLPLCPLLPVSKRLLAATESETVVIVREFANWAVQQTDPILVEVRKSAVAAQLTDRGVSRAATILKAAVARAATEQSIATKVADAEVEEAQRQTPEVLEAAKRILQAPNILEEMLTVTTAMGHIGEVPLRLLVFLSAVAGLTACSHEAAIHLILKGPSSGGKNAVLKRILDLLPKDKTLILTNATEASFAYAREFVPVLVFQEVGGQKGIDYVLRQIQSEGVVSRQTAKYGLVETKFKTSVITTTTRAHIHPENETRAFSLSVSDKSDLTRLIIEAEARTAQGIPRPRVDDTLLLAWHEALSQLQVGEAIVPFALDVAETFPNDQVRDRRDFPRVMNLIRACALLHQFKRERDPEGRIIAEQGDYDMVRPVLEALEDTEDAGIPLSTYQGEKIFALIGEMAAKTPDGWVRRMDLVRQATASSIVVERTVRRWCERFVDTGLCEVRGVGGRLYYRLKDNTKPKAAA